MENVFITDVSPRDGFQNEKGDITTAQKVETVDLLTRAGVPAIEVTSFVHPKAVPQMADATEVMKAINRSKNTNYEVLVPNLKGADRAVESRPDQLNLVVSASESHNKANLRTGTFETMKQFPDIFKLADMHGIAIKGGLATSFGCPFEGEVAIERVLNVISTYIDMGTKKINLADTTGMANPQQVKTIIHEVKKRWNGIELHCHFHNTRGAGLANVYAAFEEGVRHFDASLGGIGGCPFAPGATGNISTEDTLNMLHDMGIETGIDLDVLLSFGEKLEAILGHGVQSQVYQAGKTHQLHPLPEGIK
ncbi:hydroxymethylglutaryl-CoA lyase [Alteribacillus sp. JSM 102045]|uniref:hydroxymethylglutaryl-CoA lyase n=1 Tax=Alteribacillus sp. JSM 102045 TaxID=1562101 RepID=UPI0035C141B4